VAHVGIWPQLVTGDVISSERGRFRLVGGDARPADDEIGAHVPLSGAVIPWPIFVFESESDDS